MKKIPVLILMAGLLLIVGCGAKKNAVPADGVYRIGVMLEGGSGKASVESPALLTVENGDMTLLLVWSSDKYDYMILDGERYLPELTDGHSVFEIPLGSFAEPLRFTAYTTAMSMPHEIDYTLRFDSDSLVPAS